MRTTAANPITRTHFSHPLTLVFHSDSLTQSHVEDRILQQALTESVWILDTGNCFNPLRMARPIRRQTPHIHRVLERIQVARAFTCFQVVSLLTQTSIAHGSVFILRLLTTFADEMIPVYERIRLLKQVNIQIDRLRRSVPVTVTIKHTRFQDGPLTDWISRFQERADAVIYQKAKEQPQPTTLF
jgi:hypothetical protein